MLRIGLTGGIGSGKTTVSNIFSALEVPIIDADIIARKVVEPGTPGLRQLISAFGQGILDKNGCLDRPALRKRIFSDTRERANVEKILHPQIREEIKNQIQAISAPYCILSIPLLIENGWQTEVDRVLVVDAPEQIQISRTTSRDDIDSAAARAIIASQVPRDKRLAAADDIIDNNTSIVSLNTQVNDLHHLYLKLASQKTHD